MNTLPKLMLALVILLTVAGVTQTCAQVAPVDDRDINQRSFNLGLLRTGKPSKKTSSKSEDPKVVLAQIQEDFTRIQVIDNELIEALQRTQLRQRSARKSKSTRRIRSRCDRGCTLPRDR